MTSDRKKPKPEGEEPGKRGPKPEHLVIPPDQIGGVIDRLLTTPKDKAKPKAGDKGGKKQRPDA